MGRPPILEDSRVRARKEGGRSALLARAAGKAAGHGLVEGVEIDFGRGGQGQLGHRFVRRLLVQGRGGGAPRGGESRAPRIAPARGEAEGALPWGKEQG